MKKILCLVLTLIIALPLFMACKGSGASVEDIYASMEKNKEKEDNSDLNGTTETAAEISDDIPELNFNGENVSVLYRDYMEYEVNAEKQNGEVLNDAVYKRNMMVEERFSIKFNMIPVQGAWDHKDAFLKRIRNSVSAGDDEFDIIEGYAAYIVDLTSGGYLNNWKTIPYVGLDKPWWNQDFVSEMTVNNKLFYLTGDLALSTIWEANVLFYNKKMWQDYALDDPYAIVRAGKWTLDRMAEITKNVSGDVDNNGRFDEADLYGYVTDTHNQVDAYVVSFDIPITVKDENGWPKYVIQDEKFTTAFMRLYTFMRETVSTFAGPKQPTVTDIYSMYRPMFQDERALILAEYLGNASQMRDYEFDFGILPFPKLDDNQEKYKTMPQNGYTMFCTPVTVKNTDKVGAVIEALAAESRRSVVPAFYEVALKTKYARDEESAEMIDIIRAGISFNFGMEYVVPLGNPHLEWRFLITDKKNNIVSSVEKKIKVWEKNLTKILSAYED